MSDNLSFDESLDALKLVNKVLNICHDSKNPKVIIEALSILTGAAILSSGDYERNLEIFIISVRKIINKHKN